MKGPYILPDYNSLPQAEKQALEELTREAEAMFQTAEDEFQATMDNNRLPFLQRSLPTTLYLWPDVGLSVAFASRREVMDDFLAGKLSEEDLYDLAIHCDPEEVTALYLTMVFVRAQMRGRGYGLKLLTEHVRLMDPESKLDLFSWIYSKEGLALLQRAEQALGRQIRYIVDPNLSNG